MSATCYVLATMEMTCPLCRVVVPPNTRHTCATADPWRDTPQPPGSKEAAAAAERLKNKPPAKKKKRQ